MALCLRCGVAAAQMGKVLVSHQVGRRLPQFNRETASHQDRDVSATFKARAEYDAGTIPRCLVGDGAMKLRYCEMCDRWLRQRAVACPHCGDQTKIVRKLTQEELAAINAELNA